MSKTNEYYLIARNEKTNEFKVVPVNNHRSSSLEDIDLFTIKFQSSEDLTKFLNEKNILSLAKYDFFIVNQKKIQDRTVLKKQELLFRKHKAIKDIAENSKAKSIYKSGPNIDAILDSFAYYMQQEDYFWGQVVTGKTNIYSKYADYFVRGKNVDIPTVKYRDGGWARKSYPLIRNILEAESRPKTKYETIERDMYRSLIDDRLFEKTKSTYADEQISMFDFLPEEKEKEEKLLEVLNVFENLPRDVFIIKDEEARFNENTFSSYNDNDLEIFRRNLPEKLQYVLQLLAVHKDTYKNFDSFQLPITQSLNAIVRLLKSKKQVLDRAYDWAMLYVKYKEKALGDVSGRGYQKEN